MLELRLAGVHEDGENLVLEAADGTSYLLPIDQNLRTSIAKARRIQPIRGRGGSGVFGPRDIQARFRQGASVEEIVNESGWDAERVRKYEWPIIAERQHIISAARNARISDINSRGGSYQNSSLDQRLGRVLSAWRLDEAEQYWSTYQQESGQWTVSFEIPLTEQQRASLPVELLLPARWTYNPANQSIYASNDAAYFFMGRTTDNAEQAEKAQQPTQPAVQHQVTEVASNTASAQQTQAEEKHVDFARHADENTQFPRTESLKAVRVPKDDVQEEILEELDSRRGTRDFGSASERKLADLLERARRTSAEPSHQQVEETSEPTAEAEVENTSETGAQEIVPVSQDVESSEELSESEVVEEPAETETFTSRAERRNRMMQKYLDSQNVQQESSTHESDSVEEPEQTAQKEIEDKLRQVQSERDAAGSSWRSQNQAKAPAEDEVEEEAKAQEDSEPAEDSAEETPAEEPAKPARSSKPKRASVPSWDDIIFGSQRK